MRIDFHCHSLFSADASSDPDRMVAAARECGLDGIAITDHDSCEAVEYFRAVGLITEDGLPVDGFLIIPGVEVTTADGHLLCIGFELRQMFDRPAREVCEEIHARGGLAIPAHPYDHWRAGIREEILDELPIDALEVFNAAATRSQYNAQARQYAERRGLPMTASSDSHLLESIGCSSTEVDVTETNVNGVLDALRSGRTRLHEEALGLAGMVAKSLHNFVRSSRNRRLAELRRVIANSSGSGLAV